MPKITLNNIGTLEDNSSLAKLNENFQIIIDEFDNAPSRNGIAPSAMLTDLDMNSNQILNLPDAISAQEPVTLSQIQDIIVGQIVAVNANVFNDKSEALLASIDSSVEGIRILGYTEAGDGGEASYVKVVAEPSHEGKIQSADGAWWEIAEETVSVKMFGAKGDGTNDDTTSISNSLAYLVSVGGGKLYVPTGVYKVTSKITVTCNAQQSITIEGDGRYLSTLDFQTASDLGLYFHSTNTTANQHPSFEISKIGLVTSKKNCGSALYFNYDTSNNINATVDIADVHIGSNLDRVSDEGSGFGYWTTGIRGYNARNGEIRNLHAFGEMQESPESGRGIWLEGDSIAFVISDSLLLEWTTGLDVEDTCEGIYLNNTDIIFTRFGVKYTVPSGSAEPQFTAIGCHFNCANVAIWLTNVQQSVISGCLIYATSALDTGTWPDFTGCLFVGTLSKYNKVVDCTFSKESGRTGDNTTAINFSEGSYYTASGNHVFGLSGNAFTFGFIVASGVSNVTFGEDNIFENVSLVTSFSGTKTVRQPLVQSGTATVATGATITFPSEFPTSCTSVVACCVGTTNTVNVTVDSITASDFDVYHTDAGSVVINYIATGY